MSIDPRLLLVLPLVIPMATGVLALMLRGSRPLQRTVCVVGAVGLLAAVIALLARVWEQGVQATQMGGWPAPYGITVVVDLLSAALLVVTALAGLAVVLYSLSSLDETREQFGYFPLVFLLIMGVNGAFITGDLFNLYVWFEVLLIASFVLLVLGNEPAQLEGGIKYVVINLVSSATFLAAIGLLYGFTGALNMADLAGRLQEVQNVGLETTLATLFLIAFGIKAALFPLFFWLPSSYHTPPAPVAAIFAGLLTKVGIYSLIRVFTLLFQDPSGYTQAVMLVLAGFTMLAGVLGALVEQQFQRLLAFLVISAMGYIVMGLAFYTPLGLTGAVFYTVQDVLVKTMLFLMAGLMQFATGSLEIDRMGGLYLKRPWLGVMFFIPALALAGFPPFSGFWPKLILIRSGLEIGQYVLIAVALVVGLLTLVVVAQVWSRAFWRPSEAGEPVEAITGRERWMYVPVGGLALLLLAIGLYPQPLYGFAERAAALLLDTEPYIQAVLGS